MPTEMQIPFNVNTMEYYIAHMSIAHIGRPGKLCNMIYYCLLYISRNQGLSLQCINTNSFSLLLSFTVVVKAN